MKKIYPILYIHKPKEKIDEIKYGIESFNFHVTTTENPKEAIELLKTKKFKVLILDLHIKDSDGLDYLKENENILGGVITILLSSSGAKSVVQRAQDQKVGLYLLKPIRPQKTVEKIQEMLNLEPKDILNKSEIPFTVKINHFDSDSWELFVKGCPIKNPTKLFYKALVESSMKIKRAKVFICNFPEEYYYFPEKWESIDQLLKFLEKQYTISPEKIVFKGDLCKFADEETIANYEYIQKVKSNQK
ncbi:MAG: response regulator [Leptospiraceae bacterium]|nr:response regulator [Leptospiraceae bacterium]